MIQSIRRADCFWTDMLRQVDWYRANAGPEVAVKYVGAIESTLRSLAKSPTLGRLRFSHIKELEGIRAWRVEHPYQRHLIFYRFDDEAVIAERVIHGARDLPRRLLPP
jgi:plasmid stabilization system protein ParE